MPSAFVPFMKSARKSSGVPALAASLPRGDSAEVSGAFAAAGANGSDSGTTCGHAAPGTAVQPLVTLKKDGDRVTHIRIECACGQVVELECAY